MSHVYVGQAKNIKNVVGPYNKIKNYIYFKKIELIQ